MNIDIQELIAEIGRLHLQVMVQAKTITELQDRLLAATPAVAKSE